jgi:hypothetical protein
MKEIWPVFLIIAACIAGLVIGVLFGMYGVMPL